MVCKNCGSEMRSDASFCTNCGTRVEKESVGVDPQPGDYTQSVFSPHQYEQPQQHPQYQNPQQQYQQPQQHPQYQHPQQQYQQHPQQQYQQHPQQQFQQHPQQQYQQHPQQQYQQHPQQQYQQHPQYQHPQQQQQQYYQPPPPYASMQGAQKNSKTGLIVGLILGGVALIIISVVIALSIRGVFDDNPDDPRNNGGMWTDPPQDQMQPPAQFLPVLPDPTPPSDAVIDSRLVGVWARDHGRFIWFFGEADFIGFTENDDGTFEVYESEHNEHGTWYINSDGKLIVLGYWTGTHDFTFEIDDNRLTLIDSDGDRAYYERIG